MQPFDYVADRSVATGDIAGSTVSSDKIIAQFLNLSAYYLKLPAERLRLLSQPLSEK